MDDINIALIRLSRTVADALNDFAASIEAGEAEPERQVRPAPESVPVTGHRQKQIVALSGIWTLRGMTTGEVSRLIEYDQPNVYNTMQKLQELGVVERADDGDGPQRWRLTPRFRVEGAP